MQPRRRHIYYNIKISLDEKELVRFDINKFINLCYCIIKKSEFV
jgi:hypothetical protein